MIRRLVYWAACAALAAPAAAQVAQFGMVCQTPYGWCGMPGPALIGSQCFCATPQGPIYGTVRQ